MSQGYKLIHEFEQISVGHSNLQVNQAGTSLTLGNDQSGDLVSLNSTAGSAITLPAPAAGLNYSFLVSKAGNHAITAPGAKIVGNISVANYSTAASLATGAAKTSLTFGSGVAVGDSFSLVSDGTLYFLRGVVSNANALSFA